MLETVASDDDSLQCLWHPLLVIDDDDDDDDAVDLNSWLYESLNDITASRLLKQPVGDSISELYFSAENNSSVTVLIDLVSDDSISTLLP